MNGVIAPGIEWVAAQDATNGLDPALHHSILINRLVTEMRAGRVEAASIGRKGFGKTRLVQTDESQQNQARPIAYRAGQVTQVWFMGIIVR